MHVSASHRCRHCPPSRWVVFLVLCHPHQHSVFHSKRYRNHAVLSTFSILWAFLSLKAGFTRTYSSYPFANAPFMRSLLWFLYLQYLMILLPNLWGLRKTHALPTYKTTLLGWSGRVALTRQDKTRELYLTRVAQSAARLVSLVALAFHS